MLWLKRNLLWALAILGVVVLTAAGGLYVWSGSARNQDLNQRLGAAKSELNRLTTDVRPSPTPENVKAAREDVRRSQEYSALARRLFVPTPYQPNLNSQAYRSMLETNLAELRRLAAAAGVRLETNAYCFSFDQQASQMTFEPASLKPLSEQLTEISEVCRGLFNARIHTLEHIRRVAVSQYDTQGGAARGASILPAVVMATNRFTGLWAWPYEFTFECFSAELASALEEFNRIPRMLIVKAIEIESSGSGPDTPAGTTPTPAQPAPPGSPPSWRGGRRPPGAPVRTAPAGKAAAGPAALTTVLEERLLRVVMQVQVVKPVR